MTSTIPPCDLDEHDTIPSVPPEELIEAAKTPPASDSNRLTTLFGDYMLGEPEGL